MLLGLVLWFLIEHNRDFAQKCNKDAIKKWFYMYVWQKFYIFCRVKCKNSLSPSHWEWRIFCLCHCFTAMYILKFSGMLSAWWSFPVCVHMSLCFSIVKYSGTSVVACVPASTIRCKSYRYRSRVLDWVRVRYLLLSARSFCVYS